MHEWLKEKAMALKDEIEEIGCDNLTPQQMAEAETMSQFLKNMMCVDKDYNIISAMEKADDSETVEMIEKYTDYPTKMYYQEQLSKSELSRRGYVETKELHRGTSSDDKKANMESLNRYIEDLAKDMAEMVTSMDAEEKQMLKTKLSNMSQRLV